MNYMKVTKSLLKMVTLSCLVVLGSSYSVNAEVNADPDSANTPLQGTLNLSENGGFNPNPPSALNKKTNIDKSYFGISYVPQTISFNNTALPDGIGTQEVSMNRKDGTLNIGVKDKTREDGRSWTLTGKVNSNLSTNNAGIALKLESKRDVMRNMNDGDQSFESADLIEQVKKSGNNEVNANKNITLNTESQSIMYSDGYFVNGVYDYEVSDAKLVIPNVDEATADTISTTIQWNLESTPRKTDSLIQSLKDLFEDEGQYIKLKEFIPLNQIQGVENEINRLEDLQKKQINLEHYNRYVKGYFVQWDLKGEGRDYTNTIKFIGSDVKKNALLRIYRAGGRGANDMSNAEDTYLSVKVTRNGEERHNYSEKGKYNPERSELIVWEDLKPGDIIEYTTTNPESKLDVFPNDYKKNGTMQYKVTDQYKIVPMN